MKRCSWTRVAYECLLKAIFEPSRYYHDSYLLGALTTIYAHSRRPETRAEAAKLIQVLEGRG